MAPRPTEDQELTEEELQSLEPSEDDITVEDEPDDEETSEAEPTEGDDDEEPVKDPSQRTVPHGAFHQEREKRKASEARAVDAERKIEILSARFNDLLTHLNNGQQQQQYEEPVDDDPPPDRVAEPFKYMEWQDRQIAKLAQRQDQAEHLTAQQRQHEQDRQNFETVINHGNNLARQFAATVPDYNEAYTHAYQTRFQQLRMLNFDDEAIPGMIQREMNQGILMCLAKNVNPGAYLYEYSKSLGYRARAAGKLDKVAEGQRKFKSMGSGAERKEITAGSVQDILAMDEDQFKKFLSKSGSKGVKKAFLGG